MDGEEENVGPFRRTSARTRRMASRMASALASSDNRAQAALARLEALESDNAGVEVVDLNDDEYGSTDEEDPVLMQKKQSKIMKRKTRQGKALEKRAARSFMDVVMDVVGMGRIEEEETDGATVPRAGTVHELEAETPRLGCEGRWERRPRGFTHGRQERRQIWNPFLLTSLHI